MKDFSIEYAIQNIYSDKTKEYFKEVSSSYFNGNYRAAIVTLYSVTITDILIKLEVLEEIYSDHTAKDILQEIRVFQEKNPNSADWERDIIDKVKNRTNLLDNVDYAHILALRNDRHLCAHPFLNKEYILYTPNKETVAAHIRNMLESLFLKPAVLSKKILKTLLEDISEKSDILLDDESTEKYIKAKYLQNTNPNVEVSLFRDLWKFVFYLNDKPSEENRLINFRVMYFLYKRNMALCMDKIQQEQEYFSNILNREYNLNFFIRFIAENEFLYEYFRQDLHLIVSKHVEKDISARTVAWFLNESFLKHLEIIKNLISGDFNDIEPYDPDAFAYQRLLKIGYSKGYVKEVSDFVVWRYSYSKSFNDADKIFNYILKPNLNYLTLEQFEKLCSESNNNPQAYYRKRAEEDHQILQKFIANKFEDKLKFEEYKNIFK